MVKALKDMLEDVVRCNKCGFCQEVCPTYKATGEEFSLARGRNRLIRLSLEGTFDLIHNPEINHHIYSCLLCGACVNACPSSVITDTLVKAARAEITRAKGQPFPIRLALRGVLAKQRRLTLGAKALRFYQRSGARWLARHTGFLKLLGALGKAEGLLPDIPGYTLRDRLPHILKPPVRPRYRVAYFAGCVINNFFPAIGEATLRVLQHNDCEVVVPSTNCCGIPHEAYGDVEILLDLAKQNLEAFKQHKVDAIITDCASCAHGLHNYAQLLEDDPHYKDLAREVAGKVQDAVAFLASLGIKKDMGSLNITATYHDPCHAVRGLKVKKEPREILKAIPGVNFVEMNEADWCCGGAGSYNVTHYELSMRILERKMKNFQLTGAQYLVTSCPACLLQLAHGLNVHGLPGKAVHIMQLLDQAYQKK
ncbi:MAG: (Fe-S)-binding protein [Thermanaeromonas sp.]|uniref:(Fe-S)-binding protein n=1 Tax=Thermanaeromonas sp. TaxID=2003697 RepID=UPI00243A1E81|nr:(Fe-S)-binding protein [Thermanaeromonas sp.]MCG0277359.1 (Fe-S)-binding protein [Thermanaeromonas sp.]